MSSMKKNALAAALVAGLGMAGAAAAYNYGTLKDPANCGYTDCTQPGGSPSSEATASADLLTAEPVAYQNITISSGYDYTMREQLVWDINPADNAVNFTNGFTARLTINDGALFDTSYTPTVFNVDPANCTLQDHDANVATPNILLPAPGFGRNDAATPADIYLDPSMTCTWDVNFDNYYTGGQTISIRVTPKQGVTNPQNPSGGMMLRYDNAHLTSLNEFVNGPMNGIVDGDFWLINPTNDAPFTGSLQNKPILQKVSGVEACANSEGAETDKYIDVADNWLEEQLPKTRFSFDGKLGSAVDADGGSTPFDAEDYDSQVIDLGNVTLDAANVGGGFTFDLADDFNTVLTGDTGGWLAFENGPGAYNDDIWLVNGTCSSGTTNVALRGQISGNTVFFDYTGATLEAVFGPGVVDNETANVSLTVCGFVNTDVLINDQNISVTTTFTREDIVGGPQVFGPAGCDLLPLRYNGSTMEIFTINPGSNTTQRSFIRLTNRSTTNGYVSLEGIDNAGNRGASQVRVWVPAGASVQMDAADLENGTNGAVGAWGTGNGKWRAVVTAEFPGLVATSLVNATGNNTLQNITDSDTRGEQYIRDYEEGNFANDPGERPSDFVQESTPDFHGNGSETGEPGGPNGGDGPSGGQTTPDGNPGITP